MIRVLLADDQDMVRSGLRLILELAGMEVVGEAADGAQAATLAAELLPDVVLMDVRMPGTDGIEGIRRIVAAGLPCRVLVLTTFDVERHVYDALQAGAAGFLSKDASAEAVCNAVGAVARGETVLGPEIQAAIARELRDRAPAEGRPLLSAREREILSLTAEGLTSPDIGKRLHLSPATVKTHLQNTYEKLGVSDRAAAVAEGMRRGLLE